MSKRRKGILGALLLSLGLGAALPAMAQEGPPPIGVEVLTPRSSFTDDIDIRLKIRLSRPHGRHWHGKSTQVINMKDPSRTVVVRITVQPGAQFPWHTHQGPVIVNVAQGELVYVAADDCVERSYPAGTAFVDSGRGHVHTAFNPTDEETVFLATFYEVDADGPLTITDGIEPPDDCTIDIAAQGSN